MNNVLNTRSKYIEDSLSNGDFNFKLHLITISYLFVSFPYTGYYLRAQSIAIQSTTCDISITWNHPSRNADLVTGYEVYLQEKTDNSWKSSERIYAGSNTEFTSPCSLQSGRLYRFFIRSQIVLSNPAQAISVDSSYLYTILGYIYRYVIFLKI